MTDTNARRSKSLELLIPVLYLKGVSTGDFEEALVALLGKDAGGLSGRKSTDAGASVTSRPKATSISGSTAFMFRPGWKMRNACYCQMLVTEGIRRQRIAT